MVLAGTSTPTLLRTRIRGMLATVSFLAIIVFSCLFYLAGVLLIIPFFHPPKILPISSSCLDNSRNLLFGICLFSQAICKKNFNKSSQDIALLKIGLPLGNLTSQLFANIYMNVFDQFVKHKLKVKHYIRYADDFVFLSSDKEYLESLILEIKKFLAEKLKLTLHPNKTFLQTVASGVDFLGWLHFTKHRILRKTTQTRMLNKIVNNPKNETIQSYLGMLKHGNGYKFQKKLLNR